MSILEKALRWICIIGVFALPFVCLFVATSLFFPYITGKNFAFRIIVEIITGAWLALTLVSVKYRPRRSWILGAFAVFVIVIAIADAQGVNPFKSFWSNYERMDGWVTLAHLLAYLVVAASIMNTEKLWRRLFQLSLAVSAYLSIYGFLQVAGDLALGQGGSAGLSARVDATFGNPIYLAAYMLFHIFIAALLWVQEWNERKAGKRLVVSLCYGAVIVLDTVALLFTGTRGATLGLIGGGFLALLLFALSPGASKMLRRATVGAFAAIIVLGGGLWLARDTAFVHSVGFLDRLASISLSDDTTMARILNIGIAWQGVKERPILGWGQENYAIVFDKYYDPRMYAQEPWFDRVHNIVFDWLIAGGFIGLFAYLSIFAAALWALWRKASGFSAAEKSIFTGLFAGYFFHNLTVFDNITSYILFATILAYIAWRASAASQSRPLAERTLLPQQAMPLTAVGAVVLVCGLVWFVNANALAANRAIIAGLEPQSSILTNLQYFEQAISYGTYGTQEAREQLVQAAGQVSSAQAIDASTKQQFFDTAASEMELQEKASPLDARFPLFLGVLYDSYGDYTDASSALAQAQKLSPRKQSTLFAIAQNDQALGNNAAALQTFAAAYELDTADTDALFNYAAAAIRAGQDSLADQLLAPLVASGAAADTRISGAYAARGEYNKIVDIWAAHVKAQPQDIQGYFTLAAAYYAAGNSPQAIATLQAAIAASPAVADQANTFIQQINSGTAKVN